MWYFYSPTIIYGQDALDYLENIDGNRVFIVTDPGIIQLKLIDILTDKLKEFGKEWKIFDKVKPDPHEEDIIEGAKLCVEYKPDLIIGLGGGSSMDTAKSIWGFYENSDNPDFGVDDFHPFQKLNTGNKCKMAAIPTTSGTGAETTWAVVITRIREDGQHIKLEQVNRDLIPTYSIVDPVFTKGLPPKLTASTGFDAIAHSMEGIVSSWRNPISDGLALKAMDIIREYLPKAYKDGSDMEAREMMHDAATIAGLSFGNSQVMIGHSMGHVLGATFNIPHGLAVGLVLPYVLQFCINDPDSSETKDILGKFGKMLGIADWSDSSEVAANKVISDIKNLQKQVDLPTNLQELGIKREELEAKLELMGELCLESGSAVMSPRPLESEDFKKLFIYAFEGKDVDF